jgi:hypothetical protein
MLRPPWEVTICMVRALNLGTRCMGRCRCLTCMLLKGRQVEQVVTTDKGPEKEAKAALTQPSKQMAEAFLQDLSQIPCSKEATVSPEPITSMDMVGLIPPQEGGLLIKAGGTR